MYYADDEEIRHYNFQFYHLHLNNRKEQKYWKVAYYLFLIYEDLVFELFNDEITEIRIIKDFNPEKINELSV